MPTVSTARGAPSASPRPLILLTGATGYVGGRLLRLLERDGHRVRCLARRPDALRSRVAETTDVVAGDVLEPDTLVDAFRDVGVAYYLVHALGSRGSFEEAERRGAEHFARAAIAAGVQRIIYLGGLGRDDEELSAHLRSRHGVGEVLRASGVPTIEFRASVVIGSGSLSFELIRALVERLPIMITPRWVNVPAQPIAIDDVLQYLEAAIDVPIDGSRIYEIGGADRVSYGGLMREYAKQRGLRRLMIPVPLLTPFLSSLWLGLVTPIYARIGRRLIESIVHSTVVRDDSALRDFDVEPMGVEEAMRRAFVREERAFATTRWSDALSSGGETNTWGGATFGSRLIDSRVTTVHVPLAAAFAPIRRIGGYTGWYALDILWRVRGFLDLLVGGVGVRRGRPSADALHVGDTIDFWRVEAYEPDRRLRLQAEMRLPGRAWLEFEVTTADDGDGSTIRQTASFDPVGLFGRLYWYLLWPVHELVFRRMLRGIARAAEREGVAMASADKRAEANRA